MTSIEDSAMVEIPPCDRAAEVVRNLRSDVRAIRATASLARDGMHHVAESSVGFVDQCSSTLASAADQIAVSGLPGRADADPIQLALSEAAQGYVSALADLAHRASGQVVRVVDEAQQIVTSSFWRRVEE